MVALATIEKRYSFLTSKLETRYTSKPKLKTWSRSKPTLVLGSIKLLFLVTPLKTKTKLGPNLNSKTKTRFDSDLVPVLVLTKFELEKVGFNFSFGFTFRFGLGLA